MASGPAVDKPAAALCLSCLTEGHISNPARERELSSSGRPEESIGEGTIYQPPRRATFHSAWERERRAGFIGGTPLV